MLQYIDQRFIELCDKKRDNSILIRWCVWIFRNTRYSYLKTFLNLRKVFLLFIESVFSYKIWINTPIYLKFLILRFSGHFMIYVKVEKNYSCNRPGRPIGLWSAEDPTLSTQSAHRWWLGFQPYAPSRALLPRNIFSFLFLVLIPVRGWVNPRA
jgi:hypothetical protein